MCGTQQVRQLMGHTQFGARVMYGDCIFYTLSPNEQHSAWVLRLSRYRANDPCIQHPDELHQHLRSCAGRLAPSLAQLETTTVELPAYKFRRVMCARDPMAVMDAFLLHIRLRLPRLFGQRSCPWCPRCNNRGSRYPCQNRFGSVMRATGGFVGGSPAYGSAAEHQTHGTPHIHGEVHVCCVYQYMFLTEISELIEKGLLDPDSIMEFHSWLHYEEPPNQDVHDEMLPQVESSFHSRFAGTEHNDMSQVPEYLAKDTAPSMWTDKTVSRQDAYDEGSTFKKTYLDDAQRIFSRVQHHFHEKTKAGYKPLKACLSSRCPKKCKHDFPMEKRLNQKRRIICRGNAKRFGVRVKGKRNQLGMVLNRRTGVWQSGTAIALAVFNRSNSHTAPNFRMPPLSTLHDDEHCSKACYANAQEKKIRCKLAQRAQGEATGYYCGYTFKRQACGRSLLKATAESLNYVELGLKEKSAGRQWYKICNRTLTDTNHRCTVRTALEEFKLSANLHPQDPFNAEFIRSYRTQSFPGRRFLVLLESETKKHAEPSSQSSTTNSEKFRAGRSDSHVSH